MRPLLPILFVSLAVLAALGADPVEPSAAVVGAAATVQHRTFEDPFPIRRQFVSTEQLERILATNGTDKYQRLLKSDFEALVEQSAREKSHELSTSGIVEAEYRAALIGGHLHGSATWKFPDTLKTQGIRHVSLNPLAISITATQWGPKLPAHVVRATAAGRTAPGSYLLFDERSTEELTYQWSLRGSSEPDEDRFTLEVPAAPIAVLKLSLSNERIPIVTQPGVVVTGPFPNRDNDREQLWNFRFGNLSKLSFSIRRPIAADSQAVVLARRSMKWQIRSHEISAIAEFQLNATRGVPRDLNFMIDAGCSVVDVTGERVSDWSILENKLTVKLAEPAPDVRISIAITAPSVRGPYAFNLGAPAIPSAILESDLIEYTLGPDIRLESWNPSEYRISGTRVLPDRSTVMSFRGSLLSTNESRTERKPPTVRIRPTDVEYTTDLRTEWSIEPTQSRLTTLVKVQVVRGPLVALPIQTAPGYAITSVTSTPDDSGLTWTPLTPNGWNIEPTRAIPSGKTVEFRIEFRGPVPPVAADASDASPVYSQSILPRVITPGAQESQASLRVNAHPGIVVKPSTSLTDTDTTKPHSFVINHRNRPADGDVLFATLQPTVEYSSESMVHWEKAQSTLTTRMIARTADHPFGSLTVYVPGDDEPRIYAQGVPFQIVRHWPAELAWNGSILMTGDPWSDMLRRAMTASGHSSFWRIKFRRPIADSVSIVIQSELKHGSSKSGEYQLQIPAILGSHAGDIKVSLDEPTSAKFRVVDAVERPFLGLGYRLVPGSVPANLNNPARPNWSFSAVRQHNAVSSNGQVDVTFSCRVEHAATSDLFVGIVGASIDRVAVDGREVLDPSRRLKDSLRIPVQDGASLEIRYRLHREFSHWSPSTRIDVPSPILPVTVNSERWWSFASHLQPWPACQLSPGTWIAGSDSIRVVRTDWLIATGRFVAILIVFIGMFRLRRNRGSIYGATSLVALAGIAQWVASPTWAEMFKPVLIAALIVVVLNPVRRGIYPLSPSGIATASILWIVPGMAQAPDSATVYVSQSRTGEYIVHAPVTMLKTLKSLGQPPIPGVVITSAEYQITGDAESSSVEAMYICQVTQTGPQVLDLPLSGVQLESARLGKTEAYPDASKADRFVFPIQGIGEHQLKLKFQVTTQAQGIDRNVRFGVPEILDCKVTLITKNGQRLDAVSRIGRQTITGSSLVAEHGSAKVINVRWRENSTAEVNKPSFNVREAMLWDIDENQSRLTAAFLFRITAGSLSDVQVDVPEELVVLSVTGPGVRSWKLGAESSEGMKPLDIRLQNPVEGKLTLIVQACLRNANAPRPTLRFPRTAGIPDAERETNVAIRMTGLTTNAFVVPNAIDIPIEAFTKDFAAVPELKLDTALPDRTLRGTGRRMELRPPLTVVSGIKPLDTQNLVIVGRRLEWTGSLRAELKDANVLEYDIPAGIRVHHVTAPGLAGWSRTGNRLQAWWRNKPKGEVKLQWFGSSAVETPTRAGVSEWQLPRWPVNTGKSSFSVQSATGWQAIPQPSNGIVIVEDAILDEYQLLIDPNIYNLKLYLQTTGESPFVFPAIDSNTKPTPTTPTVPVVPLQPSPTLSPTSVNQLPLRPWLFAVGFTSALALMVILNRAVTQRFWPESLVIYGGLSAWALGFLTPWGVAALGIVGFGLLARIVQFLRRPNR